MDHTGDILLLIQIASISVEQAQAIIREGRGTQFDSRVVDAFFRALEKMNQV